ncbi:lipoprotein LpqH [Mycobacterium sp. 155]|uniref:lipoprotein LpqH n=1 Tax=Mycobacterium sp. 155 TaxID=1157943 RepID=UPI000476749B|nr:lipoprotein LpqH [Mycobacterium sp. 155]
MVTRVVMIGVASAAVAACAITGCSNGTSSDNSSKPASSESATAGTSGSVGASSATAVLIDGQNQNVSGPVTCTAVESDINVTIGDSASGIGAVVSNDSPPNVHSVGLGTVNGMALGYADAAAGHGDASATKTGNTYKITGNAVGFDTSTQKQVTKSFELDFTCP